MVFVTAECFNTSTWYALTSLSLFGDSLYFLVNLVGSGSRSFTYVACQSTVTCKRVFSRIYSSLQLFYSVVYLPSAADSRSPAAPQPFIMAVDERTQHADIHSLKRPHSSVDKSNKTGITELPVCLKKPASPTDCRGRHRMLPLLERNQIGRAHV